MSGYRLLVLVIVLVGLLPMAGCIETDGLEDPEYSVSASEPHSGDIFGDVTEAEAVPEGWYTYAFVRVTNGANESLVDSSGNWSIPGGNSTTVRLQEVGVTDGSVNVLQSYEITPDATDWHANFDVPSDGEGARYRLRAMAGNRTIDYVEITVREA